MLFDKDIAKGVLSSFYFWLLGIVAGAVTSAFTIGSAVNAGMPFYQAAFRGVVFFLIFAVALFICSLVLTKFKRECPDKWLHEVADTQKHAVANYVRNECWILAHDLLQEPLFIDFRFVFYSSCVYPLTAVGVRGSIRSGSRRLSGTPALTNNLIQNLAVGEAGNLTITQPLSREDATHILNHSGAFNCAELCVELKATGIDEVATLNVGCPTGSAPLTYTYPKLVMKIKNPVYSGLVNLSNNWAETGTDSYITLGIEIENPLKIDIQVETIKLATLLSHKNFIWVADTGEIYEEKFIDKNGEHRVTGKQLKNLAVLPLVIVGRGKVSGYLQFSLEDINAGALKGSASSLTLTDKFGEHHTESFSAVLDEDA